MKIITIVGARPQFIKAAMVSRAIIEHNKHNDNKIEELILHTGQHYDHNMSQIFFDELNLPKPHWQLQCSNLQPEEMAPKIKSAIANEKADFVLLYGDTNSTLAGALAAEQLNIPIIHIEAGLRSFNNAMPEEHNRIETDRRSAMLFCPTHTAIEHLKNEGIDKDVFLTGDVMYDAALLFSSIAQEKSGIIKKLNVHPKQFLLATVHRAENTNDKDNLQRILNAFKKIASDQLPIIWPIHPRTRNIIDNDDNLCETLKDNANVITTEPISYIDMVMLEKNAKLILTDSGGVQKEAYFHKTPCITLRNETEWTETVTAGWNVIVGTDTQKITDSINHKFECKEICEYGTGDAANQIVETICKNAFL